MKKTIAFLITCAFFAACNNSVDSKTVNDTVNLEQNSDVNNMNTTVYDSGTNNQNRDTSSYERMPNKVNDSTPR